MRLLEISRPQPGRAPSDVVRTFVFMANLEAQEASRDAAASVTAEQVLTRLKGSAESDVALFALVDDTVTPILAPTGELGYGLLAATGSDTDVEVAGFLLISLPLLEDTDLAELDVTLDAQYLLLPGEKMDDQARAIRDELLSHGRKIAATHFDRRRFVVFTDVSEPAPPAPFRPAVTLTTTAMAVPENDVPVAADAVFLQGFGARSEYAPQIAELLSQASADIDNGELDLAPQSWDTQRLEEAAARLRDRGDRQLLTLLVQGGEVLALSEITLRADPTTQVAELGMTTTKRARRGRGLARRALTQAIARLRREYPRVETMYTSAAGTDDASQALYAPYRPRTIDVARGWVATG